MRHRKSGRTFSRNSSHRRAMFRNLAANLVLHERIETTEAKAKELRRVADRLISYATRLESVPKDDAAYFSARKLHAIRLSAQFLPKRMVKTLPGGELEQVDLVHKLFNEIAPRFKERVAQGKGGGYTRTIRLGNRRGDNAPMVLIELIGCPRPDFSVQAAPPSVSETEQEEQSIAAEA